MIIRSQDKTKILNFDNIEGIFVYADEVKMVVNNNTLTIATYSTEEKAIKVLDMITETYCRIEDIKCGAVQAQKYDSFCFNMPQDSEV